jgi:hypothetical protein
MWWRIALLLLAPYAYAVILGLTSRPSAQVRVEPDRKEFGPCSGGTGAQPAFVRRPRASDVPGGIEAVELPVRGWKRIEAPGLRLDTNLAARDAEFLAAAIAIALRFFEAEAGVAADPPVTVRAFATERQFKAYAESVAAPPGGSFFDATLGEVVTFRASAWQLAGETLHQIAHALLSRRGGAAPWLQEGLAEALSSVEFDGGTARWRPGPPAAALPHAEAVQQALTWLEFSKIGSPRERRAASRALVEALIREGRLRAAPGE